jgi:hypothetical protein
VCHGAKTGFRNEPFSAGAQGKVNRFFRAEIVTYTATFTGDGIHLKIIANGVPPAQIPAKITPGAFILINYSGMTGLKIMALADLRVHNQMKVRRVHIRVTKHLALCQGSEGGQYTRFPCSTLATYDNQFLHAIDPFEAAISSIRW